MREYLDYENGLEGNDELNKSSLPIINVKINKIDVQALIDTGAEISLINEAVVEKILNKSNVNIMKVSKIKLLNANGKKFAEGNRVMNVTCEVQCEKFEGDFVVIKDMNFDIIVGEDILTKQEVKIDMGERTLRIGEKVVPMVRINEVENVQLNGKVAENGKVYKATEESASRRVNNCSLGESFEIKCHTQHIEKVQELIKRYKSLINYVPRIAGNYVHKLLVDESKPFKYKNYPIPYNYRAKVNKEINNMLKDNIIEPAKTNYINPLVVVKKKDDTIRLCLDARLLNQITKAQFDAPQNIDSMLSRIGKNTIFSKLDLKNSFWLIPLDENSRKYTGFSVDGHVYWFKVVPFGLQSASSALVRAMQSILDIYESFCLHYIDDILIFSDNVEKHFGHLDTILNALDTAGLKLNIKKCEFYQTNVKYLGYKVSQTGISIDKERIAEIKEYPTPKNLKMLRGFLGILNYYKKFVPKLTEYEIPLIELMRKNVKWEWNERREEAFQRLKNNFHDNLLLHSPDFQIPFILRTDASQYFISAELTQIQGGVEIPICFISRILKSYETRYSVGEREMCAVVFAISKLKYYLTSAQFTLETDHAALCFLMKNRFANSRIYRWSLLIQEYSFKIQHRPGKENITADALTRNRESNLQNPDTFVVALNQLLSMEELYNVNEILQSQERLTNLQQVLRERQMYRGYSIRQNFIIKTIDGQELYVIDCEMTNKIIFDLHTHYGHVGVRKTWLIFRENFYSQKDLQITKNVISMCHECCMAKFKNHSNKNTIGSITTTRPLELVAIDYISNLIETRGGYKNILVMTDNLSKFIRLYPTKRCNTTTTVKLINKFCKEIGKPAKILCDNATYFNNDKFINYWANKDIKLSFTSIRHPQANPTERYIQEVVRFLRIATQDKHETWVNYMSEIEYYLNHTPNTVTKIAPITVMLGQQADRPWIVLDAERLENIRIRVAKRIKANSDRYIKRENEKIKKRVKFKLGDLVIVKRLRVSNKDRNICAKLLYPYEGPYQVNNVINDNTYELWNMENDTIRGIFNISLLYPYLPDCNMHDVNKKDTTSSG